MRSRLYRAEKEFGAVLTATDAAKTNTETTTYDANFNPSDGFAQTVQARLAQLL